jgi:hypothetical protein
LVIVCRLHYWWCGVDKNELSRLFGYDDTVTLHVLDAAGLVHYYNTLIKRTVFLEFSWQSLFSEFKLINQINRNKFWNSLMVAQGWRS